MKTIVLFRHGKSDWDAPFGRDHERPLARRGVRDAKRMGVYLSESGLLPDVCLTSTAIRARTTMELAHEAGGWASPIRATDALYEASPGVVLGEIRATSDRASSIILAGHEPTWSSTVEQLIGGEAVQMPTAAMARIDVMVERWADVSWGSGDLIWLVTPKALDD